MVDARARGRAIILVVALFPLAWTVWESLHLHDLRMPWLGRPFIGLGNYLEALSDRALLGRAGAHRRCSRSPASPSSCCSACVLALAMNRAFRGRGLMRAAVLVPWAMPTVCRALLWRFMFEGDAGIANAVLVELGVLDQPIVWFVRPGGRLGAAGAGRRVEDDAVRGAAAARRTAEHRSLALRGGPHRRRRRPWRQFRHVTLPLLRPAMLVALIFRTLDAFRVFDLIYVMTGGGPGTATEPIALYTFNALLQNLRFGYGSALSVIVFGVDLRARARLHPVAWRRSSRRRRR